MNETTRIARGDAAPAASPPPACACDATFTREVPIDRFFTDLVQLDVSDRQMAASASRVLRSRARGPDSGHVGGWWWTHLMNETTRIAREDAAAAASSPPACACDATCAWTMPTAVVSAFPSSSGSPAMTTYRARYSPDELALAASDLAVSEGGDGLTS